MTRAEASQRVRESIVAATVAIVAREGVGALTHRRVATEAGVSLSSTTWHFATKAFSKRDTLNNEGSPEYTLAGMLMDWPLKPVHLFGHSDETYGFGAVLKTFSPVTLSSSSPVGVVAVPDSVSVVVTVALRQSQVRQSWLGPAQARS